MLRAALLTAMAVAAFAQTSPQANDYSDAKSWLCRPGRHDACDTDLTTTVIHADGTMTRETWTAAADAPVDCFYVYPTVSTDPGMNSDMNPDAAELNVIRQQFARFASVCRPYAPVYRQITLAGLRLLLIPGGSGPKFESGVQYEDIRDAFHYYVDHDNQGRGFVLVGHSQGSFILTELIRREIDGKPLASRMVSAILAGTTVAVPRGQDDGGSFAHVPLCRSATETGCVITYASFRSTVPPPPDTLFGKVPDPKMAAACTNPANLSGGSGELRAYLSTRGETITGTTSPKPWLKTERPIDTPWVSLPGLLTARCATNENATYLEVTVHPESFPLRAADITGDLAIGSRIMANWGLHLVDMNLAMGNLIDIVGRQGKVWAAKGAASRTAR
jgi:Protein of unknown function (DUF3089)